MSVLEELLKWSQERPSWQRDALRRLVQNGDLSDDDLHTLTEICKSAHGLADEQDIVPLGKEHVPDAGTGAAPVSLQSISHHRGVNALAEDQTLRFSPKLTVVYGDNAAGKTGYIRILKGACRTRGQERILGNVVSGAAPPTPVVSIKYKVGTEPDPREWAGNGADDFISRVSVFDTHCAAVYLTEKTDVAFRPFGLDLFDKLVRACKAVRAQLEREQRALASSALVTVQNEVPQGTAVAKLLASITSLTRPEAVQTLARLSKDEEGRLALLEKSLLDLQANDPEKLTRQLSLRAGRVQALARHLTAVELALSADAIKAVFDARGEVRRKAEAAKNLRTATFPAEMLDGTGSDPWTALWEAARHFSDEVAYSGQAFPVVTEDAHCVLCQQNLDHETCERLKRFEAFVTSTSEQELQQARDILTNRRAGFVELKLTTEATEEAVKEIRIEHAAVADAVTEALATNERRRKAVLLALAEEKDHDADCPALETVTEDVDAVAAQIAERIETLRTSATDDTRKRMTEEVLELRARKLLAKHEQVVLDEIERKKKHAAYGLCIDETKTQAITQKSTAVTKAAVSQRLKKGFRDELKSLAFRHAEVELTEAGGSEGVLYHKLILTRAPGVELPRVVSEGEQRCLSIAAFFAELSTADDHSGIVFDDPVSSLDYKWREGVARRLVHEAKTRQVIVFTHDVVFLLLLKQFAEELGVEQLDQHIRHLSKGAGVCAEELPWVALKVAKRIGHLKKLFQDAEKLHRDGHQSVYEREASVIYGYLREAWERGLEEVLLGGVVERYRPGVQTQQIGRIADITTEDCRTVETAMTKCSRWLPGHDQAAAARADIPDPDALGADIETLEHWVHGIRKRRG
ncbi:MAG: AAA family ATPase [Planctomycetaceae bacterium]|nr:AAA family ATPase [Planctomycetaceae bacterium]